MTAESGSQLRLSLMLTLVVRLSPICEAMVHRHSFPLFCKKNTDRAQGFSKPSVF
jgi:hypothetical protein